MQSDRHERISERAYRLWLADGEVHGKDIEHWQQAEREIAAEEARLAAAMADRAAARRAPPPARTAKRSTPAKTAPAAKRTATAATRRTRARPTPPAS